MVVSSHYRLAATSIHSGTYANPPEIASLARDIDEFLRLTLSRGTNFFYAFTVRFTSGMDFNYNLRVCRIDTHCFPSVLSVTCTFTVGAVYSFRCDISVMCPIIVVKLAVIVFSLYFRSYDRIDLNFYRSFWKKKSVYDRKKTRAVLETVTRFLRWKQQLTHWALAFSIKEVTAKMINFVYFNKY